jgi:hypothetical protein
MIFTPHQVRDPFAKPGELGFDPDFNYINIK